jgi:hypothetical protein
VLAQAGHDERAGDAVVAIVRATRTRSELEAMFALLRRSGLYERLFTPPGARVFGLLIALGEFSPEGPPAWHYLAELVEEVQTAPDDQDFTRLIAGLRTWVMANINTIRTLLTDPGKVLEGLVHLAELLWVIHHASRGDRKAQEVVEQMVHHASEAIIKAMRGLRYAETLGLPERQRDAGAHVGGNLFGILKYALLFEVLSWFIGLGEVLDALKAVQGSERIEALGRLLASLRGLAGVVKAGGVATRLERIIPAIARLAGLAEEAQATRLIALLAPEQLAVLDRVATAAEAAKLARGAELDVLRAALAAEPELLRWLDTLGDTLAVLGRAEGRMSEAGGLSAEAAAGLSSLIRHTGWDRATLVRLIDGMPAARLNEFLRTLPFVRPELFARWSADGLRALAARPRAIAALRDVGGDLTDLASAHATDLDRLERFLDGLELRNKQLGDKVLAEGLRKRLEQNDPSAFAEVLHAQQLAEAKEAGNVATFGAARLAQGGRDVLQRKMAALAKLSPELFRSRAAQLAELTDKELDGMEVIARLDRNVQDWGDALNDVLTWNAKDRAELLGLFADVGPSTDSGLGRVLDSILGLFVKKAGTELTQVQGSWGQLYAARTLIRHGASHLEFEVPRIESGLRREADIVAQWNGKVFVEVKTNLKGSPSFDVEQIRRDLVIHAPTRYDDLLYMYHPDITEDQLAEHGQRMLRLFDNPETRQLFHERGLDINKARQDFQRWLDSRPRRLTTYTF